MTSHIGMLISLAFITSQHQASLYEEITSIENLKLQCDRFRLKITNQKIILTLA